GAAGGPGAGRQRAIRAAPAHRHGVGARRPGHHHLGGHPVGMGRRGQPGAAPGDRRSRRVAARRLPQARSRLVPGAGADPGERSLTVGGCTGDCAFATSAVGTIRAERMSLDNPTSARTTGQPRGADASLSILVVDDESDLREMLTRSFSREGHRVMAVADGRAAIDRASTDHFDIVLLDVALGAGPDGYEVCRTLRGRRNVVPIIMLTALDYEADAVLGLEAGADDYVTKPFGLAELRSRIRAVLRRAGTRALGDEVLVVGPISLDRAQR